MPVVSSMAPTSTMAEFAFFEGPIVPFADANVSIGTHALRYGTDAFAGGTQAFAGCDDVIGIP